MNWMDTVGGLLQQYTTGQGSNPAATETHFDQVTSAVPASTLSGALADMFRSNDTPAFGQLAAQMFGNANGTQKASVLSELVSAAGPALPSILASTGLGALASKLSPGEPVSPEVAQQVSPDAVQKMAEHVEQHDPSIIDRLGSIYSEHPTLIKTLGSAVLAVTLAKIANRTNS